MKKVTDSKILEQLENDSMTSKKVTDPDLLAQLQDKSNASDLSGSTESSSGTLDRLKNILGIVNRLPRDAVGGAINSLQHSPLLNFLNPANILHSSAAITSLMPGSNVTPEMVSKIPTVPHADIYKLLQLQNAPIDRLAQGLGEGIPAAFVPALRAGKSAELLKGVPKYLTGFANRALPQMGYGAAVSEDPKQGALISALGQGIGETIPLGLKSISHLAEKVNPKKLTNEIARKIEDTFKMHKESQQKEYNFVTDKYGEMPVTSKPEAYLGYSKDTIDYFPSRVKKAYKLFNAEPNFQNLHDFQSILNKYAAKAKNNPLLSKDYEELHEAGQIAKNKARNYLKQDNEALNHYKAGDEITKRFIKPAESTPLLRNITEGRTADARLTPQKLQNTLSKAILKNNKSVMENHYLRDALNELSPKIQQSKLLKKSTLGTIKLAEIAQIPSVQKWFKNKEPGYEKFKNALIGNLLNLGQ